MMTLHTSPCECFGSPCSCYNHGGTCIIEFHNICTFLSMTLQFWYCLHSPSLVLFHVPTAFLKYFQYYYSYTFDYLNIVTMSLCGFSL